MEAADPGWLSRDKEHLENWEQEQDWHIPCRTRKRHTHIPNEEGWAEVIYPRVIATDWM